MTPETIPTAALSFHRQAVMAYEVRADGVLTIGSVQRDRDGLWRLFSVRGRYLKSVYGTRQVAGRILAETVGEHEARHHA